MASEGLKIDVNVKVGKLESTEKIIPTPKTGDRLIVKNYSVEIWLEVPGAYRKEDRDPEKWVLKTELIYNQDGVLLSQNETRSRMEETKSD